MPKAITLIRCLCQWILFIHGAIAFGGTQVVQAPIYDLLDSMSDVIIQETLLVEDREKKIDFDQLIRLDQDHALSWVLKNTRNLGYSASRLWLKFEIKNSSNSYSDWVIEQRYPLLQKINVFIKRNEQLSAFETGRLHLFSERPYQHRNQISPIRVKKGEMTSVYVQVESQGPIQVLFTLHEKNSFLSSSSTESVWLGIYLGTMIAMLGD